MTKLAVGSDVDAYCTKCKMVLTHTVVAMQGLKPRRVKCNTCSGDHNFRATKPTARAASNLPPRRAPRPRRSGRAGTR